MQCCNLLFDNNITSFYTNLAGQGRPALKGFLYQLFNKGATQALQHEWICRPYIAASAKELGPEYQRNINSFDEGM